MLKSDERVLSHVGADGSGLELLEDFRAANPQLAPVEWDGRGAFCRQFWHLAFLDHREYSPGMGRDCCYADVLDLFFTDHEELWRDVVTGDLVHVAHPYSWSEGSPGFVEGVDFLKSRGLNFVVSEGSWYSPGWTKLVVVARPRTLDRVGFPSGVLYFSAVVEERETERLVVMARAGEQFDVDWWVAGARGGGGGRGLPPGGFVVC